MSSWNTGDSRKIEKLVLRFPHHFLWGTAASSFQVEGWNTNADWWEWEHEKIQHSKPNVQSTHGLKSIHAFNQGEEDLFLSGRGPDHYHHFAEDFDLARAMGNNAHRLSIEWSRIEPHEGVFDQHEIEHYRDVFKALRDRGMVIMLTLHHFTNPSWFANKGGWTKRRNVKYFLQFVERVAAEYHDLIDFWITMNEPNVYAQMSFLGGWGGQRWPPEERSAWKAVKVFLNMARAHRTAYQILHRYDHEGRRAAVGYAQNFASYTTSHKHNLYDQFLVFLADTIANHSFYYLTRSYHDFFGLNYYFRTRFTRKRWSLVPKLVDVSEQGRERSDTGWEIYPHGLYSCLMDLKDYRLPIYITENGVADQKDLLRCRFLISHIQEMYYAMKGGAPVKGYFHWSLLDNYEWDLGYTQDFGLIKVNRDTLERTPKSSYFVYKKICEANGIPQDLLLYGVGS